MTFVFRIVVGLLPALLLGACMMGSGSQNSGPGSVTGRAFAVDTMTYSPTQDGIGTLYIAAFPECKLGVRPVGAFVQPNSDLSKGKEVSFVIDNLPKGKYYLAAFVDESNAPPVRGARPKPGDMVHAPTGTGDMKLDCVIATVPAKHKKPVDVPLTDRMP